MTPDTFVFVLTPLFLFLKDGIHGTIFTAKLLVNSSSDFLHHTRPDLILHCLSNDIGTGHLFIPAMLCPHLTPRYF